MPSNARPFGITVGPDVHGNSVIWFTDVSNNNAIGMIDPTSHAITEFSVPMSKVGFSGFNSVITALGGNLYFTEARFNSSGFNSAAIGIYTPATNTFNEVSMNGPSGEEPFGITLRSDGNIWFTEALPDSSHPGSFLSSAIGVVNPTSLTVSEFPLSKPSGGVTPFPSRITAGPDGILWFTDAANAAIGSINPTSHGIGPLNPIPTTVVPNPKPAGITAGPDGNLWFADTSGAVGQVALDTQLVITTQPPASVTTGSAFGLTAQVQYSDTGAVDTAYTGSVAIALTNPASNILGGTTTVTASGGIASFSGLTLNLPGSYIIQASASGLSSASTAAITVPNPPPPPAPQIQGVTVLTTQKTNKKGKRIGKPVLTGYQFTFNAAMNSAISANYQPGTYVQVTVKVGKKRVKVLQLQPIGFMLKYVSNTNNTVQLLLTGTQAFKYGGQITLVATGISSQAGGFLDGNAVYKISKGGFGISHA